MGPYGQFGLIYYFSKFNQKIIGQKHRGWTYVTASMFIIRIIDLKKQTDMSVSPKSSKFTFRAIWLDFSYNMSAFNLDTPFLV